MRCIAVNNTFKLHDLEDFSVSLIEHEKKLKKLTE